MGAYEKVGWAETLLVPKKTLEHQEKRNLGRQRLAAPRHSMQQLLSAAGTADKE
jgi:hypothetical protein